MNEMVLIKSQHSYIKKLLKPILVVLTVLVLMIVLLMLMTAVMGSLGNYSLSAFIYGHWNIVLPFFCVVIGFALILWLVYSWLRKYELVITDKRVYGRVAFGKRVDLPWDSVSAIAMTSFLNGITVSTSSGRISFLFVKNATKIYDIMNQLLLERQNTKQAASANASPSVILTQSDEADQLKKYKELLDSGVITQEEFDAKKKQLLGL